MKVGILILSLVMTSLTLGQATYPIQTKLKGEDVVILTKDQYHDIGLLLDNQRALASSYKTEVLEYERAIDSVTCVLYHKIQMLDSLDLLIKKKLFDYDSVSTRLAGIERWLYEKSIDNAYLYYSYRENSIKFIDLGAYGITGNRRSGDFYLTRIWSNTDDSEWKKFNRLNRKEPQENWESNYPEKKKPIVLTFPYKIISIY